MLVRPPSVCGVLLVLLAVLTGHLTQGLPTPASALATLRQQSQAKLTEASAYLRRFGWTDRSPDPAEERTGSLVSLSYKLSEFQRFAGLPVTGVLDDATLSKMRQPRCGVPDRQVPVQPSRRSKRYALQGSRWRKRAITYRIQNWPNSTSDRAGVRQAVEDAFNVWSEVSSLTFQDTETAADIDIRFEAGDHGDGDPFDGPGGTLAHAFFPIYGSDAHFDLAEDFTTDVSKKDGIDLFIVAAHEFGHSLGLAHSSVDAALMAPFYKPPSQDRDVVKQDDINAIQELYGMPPDPDEDEDPALCTDSSVDAVLTMTFDGKKQTYAFKGADYWRLTDVGVERDYPKKIRDKWGGVPDNLDAALAYAPTSSSARDIVFFFKGQQVWRMTNVPTVDDGYPKAISDVFAGVPSDIDAAFTWAHNNKMYFFKGNQYWGLDYKTAEGQIPAVDEKYPEDIGIWKGVPDNIDAATTWKNDMTYFFKGNVYYRLDNKFVEVARTPQYPRSSGFYWFGCPRRTSGRLTLESHQRGDISAEDAGQEADHVSRTLD